MTAVTASAARARFAEMLNIVGYGKERVLIEKHNRPVAALVSMEELSLLDDLLEVARQDDRFRSRVEALHARQDHREAMHLMAHPADETVLAPDSVAAAIDRVRYPRPATQAFKDLMAADSD